VKRDVRELTRGSLIFTSVLKSSELQTQPLSARWREASKGGEAAQIAEIWEEQKGEGADHDRAGTTSPFFSQKPRDSHHLAHCAILYPDCTSTIYQTAGALVPPPQSHHSRAACRAPPPRVCRSEHNPPLTCHPHPSPSHVHTPFEAPRRQILHSNEANRTILRLAAILSSTTPSVNCAKHPPLPIPSFINPTTPRTHIRPEDGNVVTMGGSVSKILDKIFGSKEMRLLMLGLDAAGKTSKLDLQCLFRCD
jgi:hypothetical protein